MLQLPPGMAPVVRGRGSLHSMLQHLQSIAHGPPLATLLHWLTSALFFLRSLGSKVQQAIFELPLASSTLLLSPLVSGILFPPFSRSGSLTSAEPTSEIYKFWLHQTG